MLEVGVRVPDIAASSFLTLVMEPDRKVMKRAGTKTNRSR